MDWLVPACQMLSPENEAALSIACAVLAALLIGLVLLGFGPLRTWLGLGAWRSRRRAPAVDSDAGLLGTWRLYRRLGRAEPGAE